MSISEERFGHLHDGRPVRLYRLRNARGLEAAIMTLGGILVSLKVPDRHGVFDDVVLGFDTLDGYLAGHPYFGALIGRCANRIAGGRFQLDGREWQLTVNNGANHLHGGERGFDSVLWQVESVDEAANALTLGYLSPDGEQGYPGTLRVRVRYTLNDDNELRLDIEAETDAPTPVNLTHHSYFNLAGRGDVLQHRLQINGSYFLPTDAGLIPTGELKLVNDTPMDFRLPKAIGKDIAAAYEPLLLAGGYDHNWVLAPVSEDGTAQGNMSVAAEVLEPHSGRRLVLCTDQPGLQFYSGNFLDGSLRGKGGVLYQKHYGFCLEPQHYPDSPHHAAFPDVILRPGQCYRHSSAYCFPE